MKIPDRPLEVVWDITYACPLRCSHCYSESGRRPARQLDHGQMLRAADAVIAMKPYGVCIAGGEPLLVKGVFEVIDRLSAAGMEVSLFTGGWSLRPEMIDDIVRGSFRMNVSVDGATAEVHDRIRGRRGSFDRAMSALALLDTAARKRRLSGGSPLGLGIDCVVVSSNFHQIEDFCTAIAPRFPELESIAFGAVIPEGLASREGFAQHELLSDSQVELLGNPEYGEHLRSLAPPSVRVATTDNLALQMHPDRIRGGSFFPVLQIEPDGAARAMAAYEGTVGNVLTDSPEELWRRAVERWHDPFVVETLAPVRTMEQWAEATRKIDYHFGSEADRARIDRRPEFVPTGPAARVPRQDSAQRL
ncbi:radical SAM protein [Streptosporangium roseum]|uniref:Fe-S oxidoreductase-like protein n=1 Tax=Streptosporangium roseum (strain ATCC 12428 / DSM 43021 / JCM 3005 / KCTC 9067 / NCIMB 10171 / NRRL 2505 / NI 9100) TaxID=479432 RepID=D2BE76_STRRD|nr:radical SAM protein [Streptosporangium roseum]ACZ90122.1 Fe-S oxidoreductase-like protein [Streptosporangium roseum DSM 43021]